MTSNPFDGIAIRIERVRDPETDEVSVLVNQVAIIAVPPEHADLATRIIEAVFERFGLLRVPPDDASPRSGTPL